MFGDFSDGQNDGPECTATDGRDERPSEHDEADAIGGRRADGRPREADETINLTSGVF